MSNHYAVGYVIHTPGRADDPYVNVIPVTYELHEAMKVLREERERVLPIDTEFHIYRLERVPQYIEDADLANGPGFGGEEVTGFSPEFDRYLESSEALGQEP